MWRAWRTASARCSAAEFQPVHRKTVAVPSGRGDGEGMPKIPTSSRAGNSQHPSRVNRVADPESKEPGRSRLMKGREPRRQVLPSSQTARAVRSAAAVTFNSIRHEQDSPGPSKTLGCIDRIAEHCRRGGLLQGAERMLVPLGACQTVSDRPAPGGWTGPRSAGTTFTMAISGTFAGSSGAV